MNPEDLGLVPHPEGGFYRETYRSALVQGGRAASTAIYFLLRAGDVSALHRIASDEVWHFYAGAPLRVVRLGHPDLLLGLDFARGQEPQGVVTGGTWFGARSLGDWSLVGCTVAPGFDFADFEMGSRDALVAAFPHLEATIVAFTRR